MVLNVYTSRSYAEEDSLLDMTSTKLHDFIQAHPGTLELATNTFSSALQGKTVMLSYFYTKDDSKPRAYHYYPSDSAVGICVRENQPPLDEFISLVFEVLNSRGERQFKEIYLKAEKGEITRETFAQEILKVEFEAMKDMRVFLGKVNVDEKDKDGSYFYNLILKCPADFKDFPSYSVKVSIHGNPVERLEAVYDSLQKH